jgi:hypothetical protein
MSDTKKMVEAYHVIGWYPNIDPRRRTSANMSDGAIFSTHVKANEYALKNKVPVTRHK